MQHHFTRLILLLLVLSTAHVRAQDKKYPVVTLRTTAGEVALYLYQETPKHRDNFLRLAREGAYDSARFHLIEPQGVVQGGAFKSFDPADSASRVNQNEAGYDLPAEHQHDRYFHKKYAVGAALKPLRFNPEYRTSGNQFYIVVGSVQTEAQIQQAEINAQNLQLQMFGQMDFLQRADQQWLYQVDWAALQKQHPDSLQKLGDKLQRQMSEAFDKEQKRFRFTAAQKKAYQDVGGLPERDFTGTVFGEVVGGRELVDQLAQQPTGAHGYPKEPLYILGASVEELSAKELKARYGIEPL